MSWKLRLAPMWVVLIAWATFANVIPGGFHLDDFHVVERNIYIRSLDNIPRFFVDPTTFTDLVGNRDYRPLLLTSLAVTYRLGGLTPGPFHVVNLFLHGMVALALFLLLRGILLLTRSGELGEISRTEATGTALLAGVLFGVHPLVSEPVNYVNGQAVLLVTLFFLLATFAYAHLAASSGGGAGPRRLLLVVLALLAQCGALCSKPTAITLPVMLLFCDLLLAPPVTSRIERWRGRIVRLAPFVLVNVAYLLFRNQIMAAPFGGEPPRSYFINFLTESRVLVFYYLRRFFWPRDLSIDPDVEVATSIAEPRTLIALIILALLVAGVLLIRRRYRIVTFCAIWGIVTILPVSFLTPLGQMVSEKRMYLPMFGLVVPVALLIARLAMRDQGRWRRGVVAVATLLIVTLAAGSHMRNRVWSSSLTLWEDAAAQSTEWRPHMNYALALENAGRADEALAEFETAVHAGSYARTHINLGLAYLRRGDKDGGIRQLQYGMELWPALPAGHYYLAYGYDVIGQSDRAVSEYRQALELNPTYLAAYYALAGLHERRGEADEARRLYEQIVQLSPDEERARERLQTLRLAAMEVASDAVTDATMEAASDAATDATIPPIERVPPPIAAPSAAPQPSPGERLFVEAFGYQRAGERAAAIHAYERLIELEPDHVQGLFNLAYALIQRGAAGDPEAAITLLERAWTLRPSYLEILYRLGRAHDLRGGGDGSGEQEAAAYYRRYLEMDGGHPDLRQQSADRLAEIEEASVFRGH